MSPTPRKASRPSTLWSQAASPDARMMAYTVGDDRVWDSRLLRWDILGSLGHVEGLHASRLLSQRDYASAARRVRRSRA